MRLDTAGGRRPPVPEEDQEALLDMQREIARKAGQSGEALRRAWVHRKVHRRFGADENLDLLCLDDVMYVSGLAASKGFGKVAHMLDSACLRILRGCSLQVMEKFIAKKALPHSSPHFFSKGIASIEGASFLKGNVFGCLNSELCSVLWLVTFLVDLDDGAWEDLTKRAEKLDFEWCQVV